MATKSIKLILSVPQTNPTVTNTLPGGNSLTGTGANASEAIASLRTQMQAIVDAGSANQASLEESNALLNT